MDKGEALILRHLIICLSDEEMKLLEDLMRLGRFVTKREVAAYAIRKLLEDEVKEKHFDFNGLKIYDVIKGEIFMFLERKKPYLVRKVARKLCLDERKVSPTVTHFLDSLKRLWRVKNE